MLVKNDYSDIQRQHSDTFYPYFIFSEVKIGSLGSIFLGKNLTLHWSPYHTIIYMPHPRNGVVYPVRFFLLGKSVKTTEFRKSRIRSLIKVGYFISPQIIFDLGCHIELEPYGSYLYHAWTLIVKFFVIVGVILLLEIVAGSLILVNAEKASNLLSQSLVRLRRSKFDPNSQWESPTLRSYRPLEIRI